MHIVFDNAQREEKNAIEYKCFFIIFWIKDFFSALFPRYTKRTGQHHSNLAQRDNRGY
jgi:hypothetical protein